MPAPVIITLPRFVEGEAEALCALSVAGVSPIHIRKPDAAPGQTERLLAGLRDAGAHMNAFTLHYDEPLARKYGLGGVHLRGDDLSAQSACAFRAGSPASAENPLRRSCSAHSWAEVRRWEGVADYLFLSPLFDSLSKPGYRAAIDPVQARRELRVPRVGRVVALGGITPERIARVRAIGFDGAAALGSLWVTAGDGAQERIDAEATLDNYRRLARRWKAAAWGDLQFISDGNLQTARQFLEGGGRWVQLRIKDAPISEIAARGGEMLALCRRYGALLLVNDCPALAAAIGADGVHLGKNDAPPAEARRMLGSEAIIGATANTMADIERLAHEPVDYIGLGPFRFTTTKRNLSPVIGAEGYARIMRRMHEAGIGLPVVAIGGIVPGDVPQLMAAGVPGIAVSGAVARAADPAQATREFRAAIKPEIDG